VTGAYTVREFTPASAALGMLYTAAEGVKLGLTASTTGRAPAMTEMFARGGHDGPQTYETGDPTLKVERARGLEASLRVNKGAFRFEGSLYSTWFDNYIYGALTGRTCDDDGVCVADNSQDLREVFYRQQGAHFRGLEGQASYDLIKHHGRKLSVNIMGDLTRATLSDGNNVPRIAPWRIGGGVDWTSAKVDAGANLIHYGRQDQFGQYDTPTDGYNALSAHVTVRPFAAYPGWSFPSSGKTSPTMCSAMPPLSTRIWW
jgi:iron complex outermembrane receptor protein